MSIRPFRPRNYPLQPLLYLKRRSAYRQFQPVRHPEYMRIHSNRRMVETYAFHHVGRFAPHARQLLQLIEIIRHLTAILLAQQLAGCQNIFCLIAEQSTVVDLSLKFLQSQL